MLLVASCVSLFAILAKMASKHIVGKQAARKARPPGARRRPVAPKAVARRKVQGRTAKSSGGAFGNAALGARRPKGEQVSKAAGASSRASSKAKLDSDVDDEEEPEADEAIDSAGEDDAGDDEEGSEDEQACPMSEDDEEEEEPPSESEPDQAEQTPVTKKTAPPPQPRKDRCRLKRKASGIPVEDDDAAARDPIPRCKNCFIFKKDRPLVAISRPIDP